MIGLTLKGNLINLYVKKPEDPPRTESGTKMKIKFIIYRDLNETK
jgi:hypothetical protein